MSDEAWCNEFERLKQAVEDRPDDGYAWIELGEFLYHESENPNFAVQAYERAKELLPNEDLRMSLGRAYVQNSEFARGIAMMQAAAQENPTPEAYCFLADDYCRNGHPLEAENAARKAIRLEPAYEEAYYLLGESLKKHDQTSAIDAYRTAIFLDDEYALAWQALGRELLNCNDKQAGVEALNRAVTLDGEDVWSRIYLANGLWQTEKYKEADAQYRAAIALAPEYRDLRRWHQEFLAATKMIW